MRYVPVQSRPTKERLLRAYLNTTESPKGFKKADGKPELYEGQAKAREVNHHTLARYAMAWHIIAGGTRHLYEAKGGQPSRPRIIDKALLTQAGRWIGEAIRTDDDAEIAKRTIPYFDEAMKALRSVDETTLEMANRWIRTLVIEYERDAARKSFENSGEEKSALFLEVAKRTGVEGMAYGIMARIAHRHLENDAMDNEDRKELMLAWAWCFGMHLHVKMERAKAGTPTGRFLFTKRDTATHRKVRRYLRSGRTVNIDMMCRLRGDMNITVSDAVRMHKQYGQRGSFRYYGLEYEYEVSPFATKGTFFSNGGVDLAVYPTGREAIRAMRSIADSAFEHADGAIAFASVMLESDDEDIVLEEVQTDLRTLMARSNRQAGVLEAIYDNWMGVLLQAARLYARSKGRKEMFSTTPSEILEGYERKGMAAHS